MTRLNDSPRYCALCDRWADHHTDRHPSSPRFSGQRQRTGRSIDWEFVGVWALILLICFVIVFNVGRAIIEGIS